MFPFRSRVAGSTLPGRQRYVVGVAGALVLLLPAIAAGLGGCLGRPGPPGSAGPAAGPSGGSRLVPRRLVSQAERGEFLGDAACVECHPAEAKQRSSRHARTLSPVTAEAHGPFFQKSAAISDPLEELRFTTRREGDRCVLEAAGEGETHQATADYAFGSGAIGYTYVDRQDDRSVELRLSYYTGKRTWEFTPGQRMGGEANSAVGLLLTPDKERLCFSCHSTALVTSGSHLELDRSLLGVTCESCHGAGKAHVEAVRRNDRDLKMVRLSEARGRVSMELCGDCHRAPERVDIHAPGMSTQLPRMQSIALAQSACFKKGGVTCITCHDPHGDAADTPEAGYDLKCFSCHDSTAGKPPCPVEPKGKCVSCHMPRQDVGLPTAPLFRNHWIKAW